MFANIFLALDDTEKVSSRLEQPLIRFNTQDVSAEAMNSDWSDYYHELDDYLVTGASQVTTKRLMEKEVKIGINLAGFALPNLVLGAIKEIQRAKSERVFLTIISTDHILEKQPWELISHPSVLRQIGLTPPVTIIRGISLDADKPQKIIRQRPLKFLFASSLPFGKTPPNIEKELSHLLKLVEQYKATHPIEFRYFRDLEYEELIIKNEEIKPSILHLSLHGAEEHLIFQFNDGPREISHKVFIEEITRNENLSLVFLNVCNSARTTHRNEANIVKSLAKLGVPAIIGMSSEIADRASYYFSKGLYSRLFYGDTVSKAFALAVDELRDLNEYDKMLWSVPMLLQTLDISFLNLLEDINWPIEYVEDLVGLIQEFEEAFTKLQTGQIIDGRDLTRKSVHLRMILPSLTEHIQYLHENLPLTMNSESMGKVLRIRNQKDQAEKFLRLFQDVFGEILATPKNERLSTDLEFAFFKRGEIFLSEIRKLRDLLKAIRQ